MAWELHENVPPENGIGSFPKRARPAAEITMSVPVQPKSALLVTHSTQIMPGKNRALL
jgi:hypothetical protein